MNGHPDSAVSDLISVRKPTLSDLRTYADSHGHPDYTSAIGELLAAAAGVDVYQVGGFVRAGPRAWTFEALHRCGWSTILRGRRRRAELALAEHSYECNGSVALLPRRIPPGRGRGRTP